MVSDSLLSLWKKEVAVAGGVQRRVATGISRSDIGVTAVLKASIK